MAERSGVPRAAVVVALHLSAIVSEPGVAVLDVGQGAAVLLTDGDTVVMVDSGPAGRAEVVAAAVARFGRGVVDLWVHTHLDADHVGGVGRVVVGLDGQGGTPDDVSIGEAWDGGLAQAPATDVVDDYVARVPARRGVSSGARWTRGGLAIEVVHQGTGEGSNGRGLALCADVAGARILLPGDLRADQVAVAADRCGPIDLLIVSHHGSRDGTDTALIAAMAPRRAVLSAGAGNAHCHPHPEVLAALAGIDTWITGLATTWDARPCGDLVDALDLGHHVWVGSNLWFPARTLR